MREAVVPALVPAEAGDLIAFAVVVRVHLLEVFQRVGYFAHHQLIKCAGAFLHGFHGGLGIAALYAGEHLVGQRLGQRTGTWRSEIYHQRFAAPAGFDNQHRFLERVTHHRAKAQLRPDGTIARAKARLQVAAAFAVFYKHIRSRGPVAGFRLQMPVFFGRVFHHKLQCAGAFVLGARVDVDLSGAFHVRLAGENKHLQFRLSGQGGD